MLISRWGPSARGAERFLAESIDILEKQGFEEFYWLCFCDFHGNPVEETTFRETQECTIVTVAGGFSGEKLLAWLVELAPDLVHHQGEYRLQVARACNSLAIPVITGVHYWSGFLELGDTGNGNVLDNIEKHQLASEFKEVTERATVYLCSDFLRDVVAELDEELDLDVVYPCSLPDRIMPSTQVREYVTLINIHTLKGGELFYRCLTELGHQIPFMAISTEHDPGELNSKIYEEMQRQNSEYGTEHIYWEHVDDVREIYAKTKILLLPSEVDETFSKVGQEAIANGIPVVTNGRGNLEYLFENCGIILDNSNVESWFSTIQQLYYDTELYNAHCERMAAENRYSFDVTRKQLAQVVDVEVNNNVALFVPWVDQGLGIQGRVYRDALEKLGYTVHVFSYKPYGKSYSEAQQDPEEWEHENVYYSSRCREDVEDRELTTFLVLRNVRKLIIPELCYSRVFSLAKLARDLGVRTYGVPNIEISRADELDKYTNFDELWCHNKLCRNTLRQYLSTPRQRTIPFSPLIESSSELPDTPPVKFLCLGGFNSITRKRCLQVCQAFENLSDRDIQLTVAIQGSDAGNGDTDQLAKYSRHNIEVRFEHLSYSQVIELYQQHHIVIHVSSHEGLGIGLYEALALGRPVITLDTQPHNEVIKDGIVGWCIDSKYLEYHQLPDNPSPLIDAAYFDTDDLRRKILEALRDFNKNPELWAQKVLGYYHNNFSEDKLISSLRTAL